MNVHVPFTENIRPICLPYTGINTQYYNQTGTIAGWGKTTDQNHNIVTYGTNKLREVDTLIFNTDLCGKLIHFMGNYAWRQSPSGNSISRYVTIVISTSKAYLSVSMRKIASIAQRRCRCHWGQFLHNKWCCKQCVQKFEECYYINWDA